MAFFPLNLKAIWTILKGDEVKFKVTPKTSEQRTYLNLVIPQMIMIGINFLGIAWYIGKITLGYDYDLMGFIVAAFWSLLNTNSLMVIVRAALWSNNEEAE
ncbi:hypothetical protein GO013_07495 [Pseudodesulfovibrio sp. JC047]|uniref:hypothetical protein n=1 Tax=Pseudodesulfovibrio sp. JC047 TaxID=2683199 RepID=UPI0013D5A04B|nr:hypothetical protein [Pseudodesulfovibrio sp. JC047]NDV19263.1 hypothetical protein [Pseudodesulfovibrio sp. JC047]